MMTQTLQASHPSWTRMLAIVVIAGYTSTYLGTVAAREFGLEASDLAFPGKATWGFVKEAIGPISINTGDSTRSRRSPSTLVKKTDRLENFNEGQVQWLGKSLSLVDNSNVESMAQVDDGVVISASISIGGEMPYIGTKGEERPPPSEPRPFNFRDWWHTRFRPSRLQSSIRKITGDENLEILQAGIQGDSPFVYTRRQPLARSLDSSRNSRFYDIREESSKITEGTITRSLPSNNYDDTNGDMRDTSVLQDEVVLSKEQKENLERKIEDKLQTSSKQDVVSVQKRHTESNDILSNYALSETSITSSQDNREAENNPDVVINSETSMPDDQGVKTSLHVNPSEQGKFIVYFEEQGQDQSSSILSDPSLSSSQESRPKTLKGQPSSKYTTDFKRPSRPRYIIVKEDPLDQQNEGVNLVDYSDRNPGVYVQIIHENIAENEPADQSNSDTEVIPDDEHTLNDTFIGDLEPENITSGLQVPEHQSIQQVSGTTNPTPDYSFASPSIVSDQTQRTPIITQPSTNSRQFLITEEDIGEAEPEEEPTSINLPAHSPSKIPVDESNPRRKLSYSETAREGEIRQISSDSETVNEPFLELPKAQKLMAAALKRSQSTQTLSSGPAENESSGATGTSINSGLFTVFVLVFLRSLAIFSLCIA